VSSEGRDPTWGLGAGVSSSSWDPTTSPSLGTYVGFGSWDPDPLAATPFDANGSSVSSRSVTSSMLIVSAIAVT
jgi:hypothetical protein